jgi:hypothetical protein
MNIDGRFTVSVYHEDGSLAFEREAKNVVTDAGRQRLVEMLVESLSSTQTPGITEDVDFSGLPGEVAGIKFLDWDGKSSTEIYEHGEGATLPAKLTNGSNMFDNVPATNSALLTGNYQNTLYSPESTSGEPGWIMDLGWNTVTNEEVYVTPSGVDLDLANMNAFWDDTEVVVKSNDEVTTYVLDTDYTFDPGDGETYAKLNVINGALDGDTLKVSYNYYDVPQEPVVGVAIKASAVGALERYDSVIGFNFSCSQGENRSKIFLPYVSGEPTVPVCSDHNAGDSNLTNLVFSDEGVHYYFFTMLPWALINPTQLAMFVNFYTFGANINDISLLGMERKKLGVHSISLGTGAGSPAATDTALFTSQLEVMASTKSNNGTSEVTMSAFLDGDTGNGLTFTEMGAWFPADYSMFQEDSTFKNHTQDPDKFTGNAKIMKLAPPTIADCDTMASHAMFGESWSKTTGQTAEIKYIINVSSWG